MTLIDGFPEIHLPGTSLANDACSLLYGASASIASLRMQLRSVAPYFRAALITGEPGSGKRRAARELHRLSHPGGPFLLYRPAEAPSAGSGPLPRHGSQAMQEMWTELLASAQGGTLVIEELGGLSAADQACLLQFLREPGRRSHDSSRTKVIGLSRQPSRMLLTTGQLRQELHSLFTAIEVRVPPLRTRPDDIEELASELLTEAGAELRLRVPQLAPDALALLQARVWPGNIAELRSVLREAMERETRPVLTAESFEVAQPKTAAPARTSMRLQDAIDEHVAKVLAMCGGNKLKTAELLGISRSTLYRMLEVLPTMTR